MLTFTDISAQSAGTVEYTDCISTEELDTPQPIQQASWWWGCSNAGALGNVEYPSTAIVPRSTLTQNGSIW